MRSILVCKTKYACNIYVSYELFCIEYDCFFTQKNIIVGHCCLVRCFPFSCYLYFSENCLKFIQIWKMVAIYISIAYELLFLCFNDKSL